MRRTFVLLTAGMLAASIFAPAVATAGGATYHVPPPNHVDDTLNIQTALDWCVAHGPGCTAQLKAGTYKTSQLVTYGFRGTFKGAGQNQTTIEALPGLTVNIPDTFTEGECSPNLDTCLWPSLIIFVDGSIRVSDLAIREPWTGSETTTGWLFGGSTVTAMIDALRFMGRHRTDVTIDRIAVEGAMDASAGSIGGFNLVNGVIYTGELPRSSTPFDYYWLSGSLTVRNSSFARSFDGVSTDGFFTGSRVTIGGSPKSGNTFADIVVGIDLETAQNSVFDVSYNTATGLADGMWVIPWQPAFAPASRSQYFIHDNTFLTSPDAGPWAQGILLYNDPANAFIRATIWNNTVTLQAPFGEGIDASATIGTVILANTITGADQYDAIGLWGVSRGSVAGNKVTAVTIDPTDGFAKIVLDPATTHTVVVCQKRSDTVLDQGTGNKIVGCASASASTQNGTTPSAAGGPDKFKMKSLGLPQP